MVSIGAIELRNPVALAPMSGLSDVPFRTLAWSMGAGYVVSEMLSGKPELWDTEKSRRRREQIPGVSPVVLQLAGSDPGQLAETAVRHVEEGVDIIDLNLGCPAKKVCKRAAGSALLSDEPLVAAIIARVVSAVSVPVTIKTRTGPSPAQKNAVRIAQLAQDSGAAAMFIHGRTRACRFVGEVEFTTARSVKAAVSMPVFVNGDICSVERARQVLEYTRADGVMVGRGAVGAPWLLGMINGMPEPTLAEKWGTVRRHLSLMHGFYGDYLGTRVARKHMGPYLQTLGYGDRVRKFNRLETPDAQHAYLGGCEHQALEVGAAA